MTDIKGYENLYAITEDGKVFSHRSKLFLKPRNNRYGYCEVKLWKNRKVSTKLIHRLVAEAFIPNPNNYSQVNHKDENKNNNSVDNLEWCTSKYNMNYGTVQERINSHKLKKVKCLETGIIYNSATECSQKLNLRKDSLTQVCRGERKSLHNLHFIYTEVI